MYSGTISISFSGSNRIHLYITTTCHLLEHGIKVGICRIRRIRKKLGICCKQKRKFRATTDSNHTFPAAENLLNQQFTAVAPNRVWVSDITYVPTEEGWLYLAAHKDLFHGEVVGYAMGLRMTKNIIMQSLFKAVSAKRPGGRVSSITRIEGDSTVPMNTGIYWIGLAWRHR